MKKFILGLTVIFVTIFVTGCGGLESDTPPTTVTSIEVNASSETIPLGLSITFNTTSNLSDSSSVDVTNQATYTIADTSILALDSNTSGVFKALAVGSTVVTTEYAGYEVNTTITVTDAELTLISITTPTLSVGKGQKIQFTANGTFTDNSIVDMSSDVNWTSSDSTIGDIDTKGLLTTLDLGSTQVSATINNIISDVINVTVNPAVVVSIDITPSSAQILRLDTVDFTANGTYSDGTTRDITNLVTWSSSDTSIVSISSWGQSGRATGLLEGNATITATINSVEKNASIDVIEGTLTSISITIPSQIEEGRTGSLSAEGTYTNGANGITKDISSIVTWSSLDSSIASVSGNTATGVGIGSTDIVATLNGQSDQSNINIIAEQWWNHLSVIGGSSSAVHINEYIQAGSWKHFQLNNTSKSSTLRIVKIYGENGFGTRFLNQTLSDDLSVGVGAEYKLTLSLSQYAPKVCFTVQDTNDNTEHSVCESW